MVYEEIIDEMWNSEMSLDMTFIESAIDKLDCGAITALSKSYITDSWIVHESIKKTILLYMKNKQSTMNNGAYDKVPLKTSTWTESDFERAGFRMVPGAVVRRGAFIGRGVVLMPCFVNIGAYIDAKTMIDSHATVGSCARIGVACHISDGVTIGGVLEPLQASPVIIEDQCFIGAGSRITEGVIIKTGAVVAAGTVLTKSTPIIDRSSSEIIYGVVPRYSVVVPGVRMQENGIGISCAVIVKRVDKKTRESTSLNELLR